MSVGLAPQTPRKLALMPEACGVQVVASQLRMVLFAPTTQAGLLLPPAHTPARLAVVPETIGVSTLLVAVGVNPLTLPPSPTTQAMVPSKNTLLKLVVGCGAMSDWLQVLAARLRV